MFPSFIAFLSDFALFDIILLIGRSKSDYVKFSQSAFALLVKINASYAKKFAFKLKFLMSNK